MLLLEPFCYLYDSMSYQLLFCILKYPFALVQVVAAGANPVQITRGIEKTAKALVDELRKMSKEVKLISLLRSGPWP